MIQDRRKTQMKENRTSKKMSQSDRSIATSRAKRDAAIKAKRGISKTKKPNDMQIDKEVKRQAKKAVTAKKRSQKKPPFGRAKASKPIQKKKVKDSNSPTADAVFGGRVPSKKAIEAAVKGMKAAGFNVPPGHQVVMTFIPSGQSESTKTQSSQVKNKGKKTRGGGTRKEK